MNKSKSENSNRPAHEIRMGRIKATIWANQTEAGVRHNVHIVRLYNDGKEWKSSAHFSREDLPLVMKLADQAHSWIFQNGKEVDKEEYQAISR